MRRKTCAPIHRCLRRLQRVYLRKTYCTDQATWEFAPASRLHRRRLPATVRNSGLSLYKPESAIESQSFSSFAHKNQVGRSQKVLVIEHAFSTGDRRQDQDHFANRCRPVGRYEKSSRRLGARGGRFLEQELPIKTAIVVGSHHGGRCG